MISGFLKLAPDYDTHFKKEDVMKNLDEQLARIQESQRAQQT
jgi:hypothetical protein